MCCCDDQIFIGARPSRGERESGKEAHGVPIEPVAAPKEKAEMQKIVDRLREKVGG